MDAKQHKFSLIFLLRVSVGGSRAKITCTADGEMSLSTTPVTYQYCFALFHAFCKFMTAA